MLERRSLMSLFVGLTLCFSIWHIMLQQQQLYDNFPPPVNTVPVVNDSTIIPTFSYASPSTSMTMMSTNMSPTTTFDSNLQLELLPKNDFSQLIDLDDFEFLIDHRTKCTDLSAPPALVVLVHSAPANVVKRQVIRETWGSGSSSGNAVDHHSFLLLFLIGAVNSTDLQEQIDDENDSYGDLVQGNFIDAYRNMTYKHVMALKWFVYNCPQARFLLKTDDDVFINMPLLYSYLEATPAQPASQLQRERLLFCNKIERAKVKRTFRSKWRVSYAEYKDKYFSNHCPGFSILYSADVVFQLYQEAQKLQYFWIDDVHITGTVASNANISITPTNSLYLSSVQQDDLISGRSQVEDVPPFLFARPDLGEKEIRQLWKLVRK